MKILIPTCRKREEVEPVIREIEACGWRYGRNLNVLASCKKDHASVNRNWCLGWLDDGEKAIMLDDDIEGFYDGWIDDLIDPLEYGNIAAVSARLLNPDGTIGQTCSRSYDLRGDWHEIHSNGVCVMPTAAIAFIHRGHRFDERFVGSGWEDNDWFAQYLAADPSCRFIQSNKCRLIHRNEQKNQHGQVWEQNRRYFFEKWGIQRVRA